MFPARRWLTLGLLAVSVATFGQAHWIIIKAELAQQLLERAWRRSLAGAEDARPWPWADTQPIAELMVPRLDERVLVLAGASGRSLAFGPGHVSGTVEPGRIGNSVITGHRDTHFDFLRHLGEGDLIDVHGDEGVATRYRVRSMTVEHAASLRLDPFAREPELTLVTCFPFDAVAPGGPLRYVVRATKAGRIVETS